MIHLSNNYQIGDQAPSADKSLLTAWLADKTPLKHHSCVMIHVYIGNNDLAWLADKAPLK